MIVPRGDPLPAAEALEDQLCVGETVWLNSEKRAEGVTVGEPPGESVPELDAEPDTVTEREGVGDPDGVEDARAVFECVADAAARVGEGARLPEPEPHADADGEALAEPEPPALPLRAIDAEAEGVAEGHGLEVREALAERDAAADGESEPVADALGVPPRDCAGALDALPDTHAVPVRAAAVAVIEGVTAREADGRGLRVGEGVADALRCAPAEGRPVGLTRAPVAVSLSEPEAHGDAVGVFERAALRVGDPQALGVLEVLVEPLLVFVLDAVPDAEGRLEPVREAVPLREALGEADGVLEDVWEAEGELLRSAVAVRRRGEAVGQPEPEPVLDAVTLRDAVGEAVPDFEEVPDALRVGLPEAVLLEVVVAVLVLVAVTLAVARAVAPPLRLARWDAEAAGDLLAVFVVVGVFVGTMVADVVFVEVCREGGGGRGGEA